MKKQRRGRSQSLIKPLLRNSFSTISQALDHERLHFTLVGLFAGFTIAASCARAAPGSPEEKQAFSKSNCQIQTPSLTQRSQSLLKPLLKNSFSTIFHVFSIWTPLYISHDYSLFLVKTIFLWLPWFSYASLWYFPWFSAPRRGEPAHPSGHGEATGGNWALRFCVDRMWKLWEIIHHSVPICSMYGIFTNICPKHHPNVGKYTIHGAHGVGNYGK